MNGGVAYRNEGIQDYPLEREKVVSKPFCPTQQLLAPMSVYGNGLKRFFLR